MGSTEARHSGHTGRREIFRSGRPQMRQSDGNKTVKRPSAMRRYQGLPVEGLAWSNAILGPVDAAEA